MSSSTTPASPFVSFNQWNSKFFGEPLLVIPQGLQNCLQRFGIRWLLTRFDEVSQPNHSLVVKGIQRAVDQHPQPFLPAELQHSFSVVILFERAARLIEIHRKLDDAEMVLASDASSFFQAAADRSHGWL